MQVGDLVLCHEYGFTDKDIGIVLDVLADVEIPPLIEVLWDNGYVSRVYQDELEVLNENR
mgnify:CR=1 FL=1|jgi:hypothetical protein